ncbi:MAG: hypothetical protein M3296_06625 [Actinomycetota bacterium]|nr:hypothetical protein [Actinomycetota bacterium]
MQRSRMRMKSLERMGARGLLQPGAQRRRMLVVVNPHAAAFSDRLRTVVLSALRGRYDVDAIDTQARDHATELARDAAGQRYDVIVAFGGDGTANEVANGLAGADTPMTCLPGGATNVLCQMLGIPAELVDATEHLLRMADDWRPRRIDLASVNGRFFTFSSGLGLDAAVVKRVDARPDLKKRLREYYFAYAAVTTFTRRYLIRPPSIEVHAGDHRIRGVTALVQNGDPYTYFNTRPLRAAEGAGLQVGTLAGTVLLRSSPRDLPTVTWRLFSARARIVDHKWIEGFSGLGTLRCVSVDGRAVPLHVDGDHIGDVTEALYAIRPRGLAIVS